MYRLILIAGLLVLLYFLLRSAIREIKAANAQGTRLVDKNQMVQDPVCRVFIPKGSAVRERIGGQTYFFCSTDCARTFQKQLLS